MNAEIQSAQMQKEEEGFSGRTVFTLEGHRAPYEITFYSKNGKDWDYSLHFAGEPGSEEQFLQADEQIESDDELYDALLDAALDAYEDGGES